MVDTYSQALANTTLVNEYYVRIRGLTNIAGTRGVVFGSFPVPSAWDTGGGVVSIDGEDYDWVESFEADDSIRSMSSKGNPKSGFGVPSRQTLRFRLIGDEGDSTTDVWLSLLAMDIGRTDLDRARLVTEAKVDATTFTVDDTGEFAGATGYIHAGLECVFYGLKTAVAFKTLTRGRFGSSAIHQGVLTGSKYVEGTGPIIGSSPLAMEGRVLEVIMCPGSTDSGVFVPNGATIYSTSDEQIYTGTINSFGLTRDLQKVRVDTADVGHLLNRTVGSLLPTSLGGLWVNRSTPQRGNHICIGDANEYINFILHFNDKAPPFHGFESHAFYGVKLQDSAAADITPGVYSKSEVQTFINATIVSATTRIDTCSCFIQGNADYKWYIEIFIELGISGDVGLEIVPDAGERRNLWREMGFTSSQIVNSPTAGFVHRLAYFTADKKFPHIRIPPSDYGNFVLPHKSTELGLPVFDVSTDFDDDDGNAVPGYLKIGKKEVVELASLSSRQGVDFFVTSGRAQFGSELTKEIYIESDPDPKEIKQMDIVQGVCFKNTSLMRILLYLILGGSGVPGDNDAVYDQGWKGSGIHVPAFLVEKQSFLDLHFDRRPTRQQFGTFKAIKLRALFQHEIVFEQLMIIVRNLNDSNRFRITMIEYDPPLVSDADTTKLLGPTRYNGLAGDGVEYEVGHHLIVNKIEVETLYDYATGKYRKDMVALQSTSIATYGEKQALRIRIRSIQSSSEMEARLRDFASAMWANYAWPYVIISIDVFAYFTQWLWNIGEILLFDHTHIPQLKAIGRGFTNLLCRIVENTSYFIPKRTSNDARSRIRFIPVNGRFARWNPSGLITRTSDTVWVMTDYNFSDDRDARQDWKNWQNGDYVFVHQQCKRESNEIVQISTIVVGTITFVGAGITAFTALGIMRNVDHDDANVTSDQQDHLYMTDGTSTLDPSGQVYTYL